MTQGSTRPTVVIGDQPVEVDDVEVKDLLIEILFVLREIRDFSEIQMNQSEGQ